MKWGSRRKRKLRKGTEQPEILKYLQELATERRKVGKGRLGGEREAKRDDM